MDAITYVCNDMKDTSNIDAEASIDEILTYMNRAASIVTKEEVSAALETLGSLGLTHCRITNC